MSDDDSGSGAILAGAALFLVAGLISFAMAVGAVVPAVGDFMSVDSTGIGGVLGYLFATVFFGGPGVLMLMLWRRNLRARPDDDWEPSARLVDQRIMPLPDGPGLAVRWLVAVPLMVLAMGLPYVGFAAVTAWSSVAFGASLPDFSGSEPDPSFLAEFGENLSSGWRTLFVPAGVLVGFLLRRSRMAAWPTAVLWVVGWQLIPAVLLGSVMSD